MENGKYHVTVGNVASKIVDTVHEALNWAIETRDKLLSEQGGQQ